MTRVRPYQYYDLTISICGTCLRRVEGKIVFQNDRVFMIKRCSEHGTEKVLLADDVAWYRQAREVFLKPSEMPDRFQTPIRYGCPYDCGLCPDHEQHSCLTLVELGDPCNLSCPVCYADSGPQHERFHDFDHVVRMLETVVRSEGEPDVVQLSGGEPTMHPRFLDIVERARQMPIQHLMINTNGVRLATDRPFVEALARHEEGLEIYLQFDSLEEAPLRALRGKDLREIRHRALENLNAVGLSTTLVVTVARGINDGELGRILEHAVAQPCVRGVTFQPVQQAGRLPSSWSPAERLTLTEVRRRILAQSDLFQPEDLVPVPCHPDAIAMGYALRTKDGLQPLTRFLDAETLIAGGRNTIRYEAEADIQKELFEVLSTGHSPRSAGSKLKDLLCCLPKVMAPQSLNYRDVFRVIIMQFLDADSFDVRSVKKSCVHIVHPDAERIIPFDTYNLFYRGDLEQRVLAPLRNAIAPSDLDV